MVKRKKTTQIKKEEEPIIKNDLRTIYIYKREWKLLNPIPYKWRLDIKKLNEFKL